MHNAALGRQEYRDGISNRKSSVLQVKHHTAASVNMSKSAQKLHG